MLWGVVSVFVLSSLIPCSSLCPSGRLDECWDTSCGSASSVCVGTCVSWAVPMAGRVSPLSVPQSSGTTPQQSHGSLHPALSPLKCSFNVLESGLAEPSSTRVPVDFLGSENYLGIFERTPHSRVRQDNPSPNSWL